MKVLNNNILLKAVKTKQDTTAIISLTEYDYYEVMFTGPEVKEVKVGDKVFYQQGVKVNIKGDDYILIDETDVIVVLD